MFLVALTGGIGGGKSTVCRMLQEKGARILDSDEMARDVVKPGTQAWREIIEHFGDEIQLPDGELDRQKLAGIIFADHEERVFLNSVTHPRIFELMAELLRDLKDEMKGKGIIVIDIPLLVEANAGGIFDYNLVVDASPEVQVQRLVSDRNCTAEEAWARIRSQAPRDERLKNADFVIRNDGTLSDLELEADKAWGAIQKLAQATEA